MGGVLEGVGDLVLEEWKGLGLSGYVCLLGISLCECTWFWIFDMLLG